LSEKQLESWFRKRRESSVHGLAREHLLKVLDTAREVDNAIKCVQRGDKAGALQAIERASLAEKAADHAEVRMTEALAAGDLPPKEREDMMHLVKRFDHIADWQKSAGRNLQIVIEADMRVSPQIWDRFAQITGKAVEAATALKACVDSLSAQTPDVARYAQQVDQLEHEVDDLYFTVKKELMLSDQDPRVLFVLRDILHALENSLDNIKSASELIHILITASQ